MRWIAISGSRRAVTDLAGNDVRKDVEAIYRHGNGVVSGGALGVEYVAVNEALKHDPRAERLRVVLPTALGAYKAQYRVRAAEGVVSEAQAGSLIAQLEEVLRRNPAALVEPGPDGSDRDGLMLKRAAELRVYRVNEVKDTEALVAKANALGVTVMLHSYHVTAV